MAAILFFWAKKIYSFCNIAIQRTFKPSLLSNGSVVSKEERV